MTKRKTMESKPKSTELKSPSTKKVLNSDVLEIRNLLAEQEKMHLPNPDHLIQPRHLQPLPDIVHRNDVLKNCSQNIEPELLTTSLKLYHSNSVEESGVQYKRSLRGALDHNPDIYNSFARRQSNQMKLPPLEKESTKRRSSCPAPASSNSPQLLEKSMPPSPKSDKARYRWKNNNDSERISP